MMDRIKVKSTGLCGGSAEYFIEVTSSQEIMLHEEILNPREEAQQWLWLQTLTKRHVLMRGIVGMHMPLTGVAVYPEDALASFDEGKIERTRELTKQDVNEEIRPDA
jgi:hypothetical protein